MRLSLLAFACAALFAATSSSAQERIEFKGVPMGAPAAEFKAAHPYFLCNPSKTGETCMLPRGGRAVEHCRELLARTPRPEETTCVENVRRAATYANQPTEFIHVVIENGRLARVGLYIAPRSYEAVVEAIAARYGDPVDRRPETLQNRAGATFQNEKSYWRARSGDHITASRYSSNVERGMVNIVSVESFERFTSERDEKRRTAPGDI